MTKISHVNVRYSEGGAARVMQALASEQQRAGDTVCLIYGYGAHGRKDPRAIADPRAARLCSTSQLVLNFAASRIGVPYRWAGYHRDVLVQAARSSDVVHLHAIHSYMGNPFTILQDVFNHAKFIVFTAHDSWLLTGRCAIPRGCTGYLAGCSPCQDITAYPPALIDNAAADLEIKRKLIASACKKLVFVALTPSMAEKIAGIYPECRVEVVANGTWEPDVGMTIPVDEPSPALLRPTLAVVAADLGDPKKTDWGQLKRIVEKTGWNVLTIGANPQLNHPNIKHLGPIYDRRALMQAIRRCDALLFQSRVDMFSLVVTESLCMGTPAIVFQGTNEAQIVSRFNLPAVTDEGELLTSLYGDYWLQWRQPAKRRELAEQARATFAVGKMANGYRRVYGYAQAN